MWESDCISWPVWTHPWSILEWGGCASSRSTAYLTEGSPCRVGQSASAAVGQSAHAAGGRAPMPPGAEGRAGRGAVPDPAVHVPLADAHTMSSKSAKSALFRKNGPLGRRGSKPFIRMHFFEVRGGPFCEKVNFFAKSALFRHFGSKTTSKTSTFIAIFGKCAKSAKILVRQATFAKCAISAPQNRQNPRTRGKFAKR